MIDESRLNGVVAAVYGVDALGEGLPADVKYKIYVNLSTGKMLTYDQVVPDQPRAGVTIRAARIGDPVDVYAFYDATGKRVLKFQVKEVDAYAECDPGDVNLFPSTDPTTNKETA
jgi:hypothetical protein